MIQVTIIEHEDGSRSTVTTDDDGRHHVEREGREGGHQYGDGRSHDDVVKNHKDPGDRIVDRRSDGG
jgi:hypothetical protein